MSLIYNATFDKNTRKLSFEDKAGNEIYSFIVPERAPAVDDITKPLTFRATQDGSTITLTKMGRPVGDFQVSWNGGNTWGEYSIGTVIPLNTGDKVSFRAKNDRTTPYSGADFYFEMTGKIEAWHNVMSMYRTNDFATYESVVEYAFNRMFNGCTSLVKAPALPATNLGQQCYRDMFNGCTSLAKAPELPATELTTYCYAGMFNGCTSLVNTPVLPATTLAEYCYFWMFSNCTSLVKAPELRATTLANSCYTSMFYGCSRLNEVHCYMPSTILEEDIPTYTGDGSSASLEPWLKGVSLTGTFYTNIDADWPSGTSGIPTGWNRVPAVDDLTKPLTFKATQDGSTVTLTKNGSPTGDFQTSTDGGNTWENYTFDSAITLNTGDEVSFRTSADRTSAQNQQNRFGFQMTGKIEARHNVMSMYHTNDFATYESVVEYAFIQLFSGCTSLTKAPVLPATTLAGSCYNSMFRSCASLAKAPVLPATTLAGSCYSGMFYGCTSLTKAPALPATTLTTNCYNNMFYGCTSLTKAPVLPATTLDQSCYSNMFNGCTSLTEAPALPATTLSVQCYYSMFNGCTSLTKAPVLSATTLAQYCYSNMFNGCSNLNEVRCKIPSSYSSSQISSSYTFNWLLDVSPTGTFYTNGDANWSSGVSGIPTGWRRVNEEAPAFDDIAKPLMFRATQDGSSVTLKKNGSIYGDFQTSRDDGKTWADYTLNTAISLNTGEEVSFRAKADRSAQSSNNYFHFMMEGKIESWHNVMSLYRTNDFATYESVVEYGFSRLFEGCTSLVKAPVLPATTLAPSCYRDMFNGCTSLTKAPELPATTLTSVCYSNMFYGCTSLVNAPVLPATTLNATCYEKMFYGCTSLVNAPKLPATTLNAGCYVGMFYGCTSLANAPALPATTLSYRCYENMFSGCTSLANAPKLPATTLDENCYYGMFLGCTSLANAPALPATTLAVGCYQHMFEGCTSLAKAPALPATTLNATCYEDMFYGCTSLVNAPKLPATTLNAGCYVGMFYGCTSLANAPALPATTLSYRCYENMFSGCTSLANAPKLPATTLDENCYYGMFLGCTSLANAPALPATTLAVGCYQHMFEGCTSLAKAPALPATTLAVRCYQSMFGGCSWLNEVHCNMPSSYSSSTIEKTYAYSWLKNVSSTGTFYTNADANWPSGASGIPEGWTRSNI